MAKSTLAGTEIEDDDAVQTDVMKTSTSKNILEAFDEEAGNRWQAFLWFRLFSCLHTDVQIYTWLHIYHLSLNCLCLSITELESTNIFTHFTHCQVPVGIFVEWGASWLSIFLNIHQPGVNLHSAQTPPSSLQCRLNWNSLFLAFLLLCYWILHIPLFCSLYIFFQEAQDENYIRKNRLVPPNWLRMCWLIINPISKLQQRKRNWILRSFDKGSERICWMLTVKTTRMMDS